MVSPKLRFSNFSGPWRQELLANLVRYTKGFAFKSDDYRSVGVRIIRVSDLSARDIKHNGESIFIDEKCLDSYEQYKIKKDEIIITTVGSKPDLVDSAVGRGIFVTEENPGLLNQNMLKINGLDGILNKFLFGQINTERYIAHIKSIQRGNANQSNITVKELLSFPIFITSFEEQTQIAYFLTSVDEKITLQTKQYDLLCQYKKGMMHKIFSQEVRFKDEYGEEFPEWEESLLSERIKVQGGFAFKSQLFSEMASTKVLRIGDISEEIDLSAFSGVFSTETPAIRYQVNKGDFVMALSGATFGKMGLIKCESAFLNQRVATFRLLDNTTDILSFYYYYMSTMEFINYIKSIPTASAQPNISNKDIELYLSFIPTKKEQTKIANFLSALDNKIAVKKAELDKLKTWKQGLLQQMFV